MFRKILIANRGEIACRIARTLKEKGIASVAVYSDADETALHIDACDEAVRIGPAALHESYLNGAAIIDAARRVNADAIHPGYGFLSENPDFVEAVEAAGLTFIGPSAASIRAIGHKDSAKSLMEQAGVPVLPGYHGEEQNFDIMMMEASRIGFPLLIKARAGGGGKGMRRVDIREELGPAMESARREAEAAFGDGRLIIEKYLPAARHIEIQILADAAGNTLYLNERECSLQRRHQKVIEEAPAPGMSEELRRIMGEAAVKAAKAVDYINAGTVEFIVDATATNEAEAFYFLEMNTRLQVEHPVTEAITGMDLVSEQIDIAAKQRLSFTQANVPLVGHAIEARLYAEDPSNDFLPSTGVIERLTLPVTTARVDSGIRQGDEITPHFDPMLAKIIVHGVTREQALERMSAALNITHVSGIETNTDFLKALIAHPQMQRGELDTAFISRHLTGLTRKETAQTPLWGVAAIAGMNLDQQHKDPNPWGSLTGWRAWGQASHSLAMEHGGETKQVEVTLGDARHFRTRIGDESNEIILNDENRITIDGVRSTIQLHALRDSIEIIAQGRSYVFRQRDPLNAAKASTDDNSDMSAPMSGIVKDVRFSVGDHVDAGMTVMILEAMKMEMPIKAAFSGRIENLFAKNGDQVLQGTTLVAITDQG